VTRLALSLALVAALVLGRSPAAAAQSLETASPAQLKAVYLLNFVKYSNWPEDSFADPASPIIMTVVGQCDVIGALSEAVSQSEPVAGRTVKIQPVALPAEPEASDDGTWMTVLNGCRGGHLLFFCGIDSATVDRLLEGLQQDDVLTVGDMPAFAEQGGMLGFVRRGNRVLFEANLDAIRKSRVGVSAKVLQLAELVQAGSPQ